MPLLSDQEDIKVQCHLQFTGTTLGAAGLGKRSGNPPSPHQEGRNGEIAGPDCICGKGSPRCWPLVCFCGACALGPQFWVLLMAPLTLELGYVWVESWDPTLKAAPTLPATRSSPLLLVHNYSSRGREK